MSWPVLLAFAGLLCVLIVLPMSYLVYYSLVDNAGAFTLANFATLVSEPEFRGPMLTTLILAIFAASDNEAGDARRDLAQLLAQLPDAQRLAIQSMKLDGHSVVEAARLTGMSESAVKVAVHRGLKKLALLIRSES